MRVKQLIRKLKHCDPNATVIIYNDNFFINGAYKVTEVNICGDEVEIGTDYKTRIEEE